MKIGILTNTFPPNLNGVSVAVKNLVESLHLQGHEVFVATPKVQNVSYPDYVLPLPSLPVKEKVSPDLYIPVMYMKKAIAFFKENQVELIHTHDIFLGGAEGIIIARKLGVPCIHTFHTFVESYPYLQVPARKLIIRTHIRLVCNNYDHITAPSIKVYKYLAEIGFQTPVTQMLNVPGKNYLKPKKFDSKLAAKLGVNPDDFCFVSFCRIASEKSIDVGLFILHTLLKKHSNCKYIIAGQGPELENIKALAKYLGIEKKVIFTGKYELKELAGIASISKVFLFTSHTENLPTNIFEAMSLGLPVLSVDDESVDYMLENNINGVKGTVDELIAWSEKLYKDPELVSKWSKSARKKGLEIQNMDVAGDYARLYERVIKNYHEEAVENQKILDLKQIKRITTFFKKGLAWVGGRYKG